MALIWDVGRIEWEDIPTLSDLLNAADEKTLLHEIVAINWEGEKKWKEYEKKQARKRYKRIMELSWDIETSDDCIFFPKHVLKMGPYWAPTGYDVKPICTSKRWVMEIAGGTWQGGTLLDQITPYGHAAKKMLGYRVWFGGTWGQREMYHFLAERLCKILDAIDDGDAHEEYVASGELERSEFYDSLPFRRLDDGVYYPEEVFFSKVYGLEPEEAGLDIPETAYEKERMSNNCRINDKIEAMFDDELMTNVAALGGKLKLGYERKVREEETADEEANG